MATKTQPTWKTERTCAFCSSLYVPTYKPQKYCSPKCSGGSRARICYESKPKLFCSWCKKEIFDRVLSAIKETNYCSTECHNFSIRGNENKEEFVTKVCEGCKKEYQIGFYLRTKSRFCSKSCAKSGERHHFWGKEGPTKGKSPWSKGLTKETDERLVTMGKKVAEGQKLSYAFSHRNQSGENNPNHGITRDQRTPEQLENYSKAAIKRVVEGKSCNHSYFKRGYFDSSKSNAQFFYRSSYEKRMMICLEQDNNVILYAHEPFYIKYGIGKRYLPDFLIHYKNGRKVLLELKNNWNKTLEETRIKQLAGEAYCAERGWQYKLWSLAEIQNLEKELGIKWNSKNLQ